MKDEKRKSIYSILDHYEKIKEATAKQIIQSLKENCSTYGELKAEVRNVMKSIIFDNRGSIVDRLEELIANEMNDLPLTDRSKES